MTKKTLRLGTLDAAEVQSQSCVQDLLLEWTTKRLGDLLDESVVRARDVSEDTRRSAEILSLTKDRGLISQVGRFGRRIATPDVGNYKVVTEGQIVYNPYVIWEGAIGALRGFSIGLVSPAYVVWQLKEPDEGYLDYLLRTPTLLRSFNRLCSGSVNRRRAISRNAFLSIEVVLPPLAERCAAAATLTMIHRVLEGCEQVVVAVRLLRQSLADRLLTCDGDVAPDVTGSRRSACCSARKPGTWTTVSLGRVVVPVHEQVLPQDALELPYVGLEHLRSGDAHLRRWGSPTDAVSTKTVFRAGDILYGKLRPYLDKAVVAPFGGICSTDILVLRLRATETDPRFIASVLHRQQFVHYAVSTTTGVNHPRTAWQAIAKYSFASPSLREQHRLSETLEAVDRKLAAEESRYAALDDLYKSVLQSLMTGQIHLPELEEKQS